MANTTGGSIVWDLNVEVKSFNENLDKASEKAKEIGQKVDKAFQNTKASTEKSFTDIAKKAASSMDDIGKSLIKLSAAPTLALGAIAKVSMDFEDSFAGVRKTVDLSEEGFQNLSTNLRNISKEAPVSVNELSRIAEVAGQLGIEGVDNITKFTETITKFTVATGLSSEQSAMSFARIANVMQEPIENIDRMGSAVAMLGDAGASTEQEILNFTERIAGAGKIAGLSTADIFGIGSAFSSVGIEAEAGGTAVQKVLISMYQAASGSTSAVIDNSKAISKNNSKLEDLQSKLSIAQKQQSEFGDKTKESTRLIKAAQIDKYTREMAGLGSEIETLNATHGKASISAESFAKVLGLTNKEFKEAFKNNPTKIFQDFVKTLGEMSKEGKDAAGVLDELELGDQRLIRAFLSLSNAGDELTRQINIGNKEWEENNRLNEEAEKRYATTSSQLRIARNNMQDMGITLGSALLPALNNVLTGLKPVLLGFADFSAKNPKLITNTLILGAALGVLGVTLVGLGSIISSILTILPVVTAAFALMITPVGLATIAIAGLVAGLVILGNQTDIFKSKQEILTTANDRYTDSLDRMKNSENNLNDARLRLNGANLIVERSQKNYTEAVKKHGEKSLEAREAEYQLESATRAVEEAQKAVDDALQNHAVAIDENVQAQVEQQKALATTESSWMKVRDAIGKVLGKLAEFASSETFFKLKKANFIPGFAKGVNNFGGGMALVGEQGPELVNLPRGSDVIPADVTSDLVGNKAVNVVLNVREMNVRSKEDIDRISEKIGFQVSISPGVFE